MYVPDIFKDVSGLIVRINNVGLILQGVSTLGLSR